MKYKILLILGLLAFSQAWSISKKNVIEKRFSSLTEHRQPQTNTQRPATVETYQTWNLTTGEWANVHQILFAYNATNKLDKTTQQNWSIDAYVNHQLIRSTYNASGKLESEIEFSWVNDAWVASKRRLFNYTGQDLTEEISQFSLKGEWTNQEKKEFETTANQESNSITYSWTGTEWRSSGRETETFTLDTYTSVFLIEAYIGDTWEPTEKWTVPWDEVTGASKEQLLEQYQEGAWMPTVKWVIEAVDAQTSIWYYNTYENGVWTVLAQETITTDAAGNTILDLWQHEDETTGELVNEEQTITVISDAVTDIRTSKAPTENFNFHQTKQGIEISFNRFVSTGSSVKVYDLSGNLVQNVTKSSSHEPKVEWAYNDNQGNRVSPGVYYINVVLNGQKQSQKFFVQ